MYTVNKILTPSPHGRAMVLTRSASGPRKGTDVFPYTIASAAAERRGPSGPLRLKCGATRQRRRSEHGKSRERVDT